MNLDEEAKRLLVGYDPKEGESIRVYIELQTCKKVVWAYHPHSNNMTYPMDLYVFELENKKFILCNGYKIEYGSFDSILDKCKEYVGGVV